MPRFFSPGSAMRLDFDIESCSAINLRDVGSYLYARHPTTDVRCVSYRLVDDNGKPGPIATWLLGDPVPKLITDIAADPHIPICAFHINFDGQILEQKSSSELRLAGNPPRALALCASRCPSTRLSRITRRRRRGARARCS